MDGQERQASDPGPADAGAPPAPLGPIGLSRRDFTRRVGAGSAAAVGLAWAAPKISTIKYAAKVAVGSAPPPGSTTTTSSSVPEGPQGTIVISTPNPCEGDTILVQAGGFAPGTAVALQLDSAANSLGVSTADGNGQISERLRMPHHLAGDHILRAVGVATGGRSLTVSTGLTIRTEAQCENEDEHNEGTTSPTSRPGRRNSTTTTNEESPTTSVAASPTTRRRPRGGPPTIGGGTGALSFQGTDAVDLALIGGAAAIGGRAIYSITRHSGEKDEEA